MGSDVVKPVEAQNLVQQGYGDRPFADAFVLAVRRSEPARAWLASLLERVTCVGEHAAHRQRDEIVHVAFTARGLCALGRQSWLDSLSVPFQDGMAAPHRSRILGDSEASDPREWHWGAPHGAEPHVLLLTYRRSESVKPTAIDECHGLEPIHHETFSWDRHGPFVHEHFGFADGIGQPDYLGLARNTAVDPVKLGELLLGYEDERERRFERPIKYDLPLPPHADALQDGTYLVVRQLEQNVFSFWRNLRELGETPAERMELATRLVGRHADGRPLARRGANDAPDLTHDRYDAFAYYERDADGSGCPFGAHIRRTNPRDWLPNTDRQDAVRITRRHRILRRGRTYGPVVLASKNRIEHALTCSDSEFAALEAQHQHEKRGVFFIGLCADIARQFEFLQQNWVHRSLLAGHGAEPDPLIGSVRLPGPRFFKVSGQPVCTRIGLSREPPVVTRGGAYFFLPSKRALRALANAA